MAVVPGDELIEQLGSSYGTAGLDDTIVITRSNKRANIYNQGIRNTILDREEALSTGDILMVVRNKYLDPKLKAPVPFIANGDRGIVRRVSNYRDCTASILPIYPWNSPTMIILNSIRQLSSTR